MRKLFFIILTSVSLTFALSYQDIKKAYEKSYMYEKIGDYKDAIRVLMPIYKAYPNGYTINLRLGWLYYLWGKYDNSEFHYRQALKAIPHSIEAKLGLSLPLMAQSRWKDVESLMFSVIYIDYYNYYANLRLCKALEEQKKYKQELQIAEKMTYIYPTSVPFLVYLAKSYYYLGNKEKAKYLFEQILILDPENLVAKSFIQKLTNQSKSPPKGGNKEN